MNIMASITPEMATNARKVLNFMRKGNDFETSYGKAMKWLAKKEGNSPEPIKKKPAGRPRELRVGEFDLLSRCPFQCTIKAAEEMKIPHDTLKGQAQTLRIRGLLRNINEGQKHKKARAVYEITEQGRTHLAEYESGKVVPREENGDVYADIMDALGSSPKSYVEIAEATGRELSRLRNAVGFLRRRGRIRQAYTRLRYRYYERAEEL